MDKFLDAYDLPKLNQEDINHLNKFVKSKETEELIKSIPTRKGPGLYSFTAEFYQTIKEELTPMFLKQFFKVEWERMLPNSFYEVINYPDNKT
jgi:hypothetical protein